MKSIRKQCMIVTGGAIALWASPALAQDTSSTDEQEPIVYDATTTYLDLTASLGYSGNPFIETVDSHGSFLGRASARGVHSWTGERTAASISGFLEGTSYFNHYGVRSIFSVSGSASHAASETVSISGSAGFSGDISGQLSNRILYVPPLPEIPDPTIPPPPITVENPDLFDFVGRTYHLYGQGNVSIQTGTRSHVGFSAGASRAIYTDPLLDEFTTVFATGSYGLTLSERTSIGASVSVNRTGYDDSSGNSTIISPTVNISTQLSETWSASGSVGVSFAHVDRDLIDDDSSTNLALNGSVCHTTEGSRFCAHIDRYSAASASKSVVTTTSAGASYYRKLDELQTVQISASVAHYTEEVLDLDRDVNHYNLTGSYSRTINDRLSGGVDLGVRALRREGLDPDTDISGTVFIRYRIGDLG